MTSDISEVRSRLASSRSPGGRVPAAMRREVVAFVERARAVGESYRDIAGQLGMNLHTLMGWRHRSKTSAVRPVRVAPVSGPSASIVRGPRGLEVEGLSVSQLAELWLRLS